MSFGFTIDMGLDPGTGLERRIRGDFYPATESARGTVIICHGYKGFKDWGMFPHVARSLSDRWDVVTFNFSHNGIGEDMQSFTELEKFAHNTYTRELEDLDKVVRKVHDRELVASARTVRGGPVYLLGHSRGGGVCLIYALDYPDRISGIISWNGIADVDLFSTEQKEQMMREGRAYVTNARTGQQMPLDKEIREDIERNQERFDIIGRINDVQVPVALVEGSEDYERGKQGRHQLIMRNPAIDRIVIAGGNHTFGARHPFEGTTKPLEMAILNTRQLLDNWSN